MSQVIGVQTKIRPLTLADSERDVELADAFDTVEPAHVSDAVLMYHPGADGIIPAPPQILFEMPLQIAIDEMNDIDLAGVACGCIAHVEIFRVPGPSELYQDDLGRIILMIAQIATPLAEPISPIHLSIISLCLD